MVYHYLETRSTHGQLRILLQFCLDQLLPDHFSKLLKVPEVLSTRDSILHQRLKRLEQSFVLIVAVVFELDLCQSWRRRSSSFFANSSVDIFKLPKNDNIRVSSSRRERILSNTTGKRESQATTTKAEAIEFVDIIVVFW